VDESSPTADEAIRTGSATVEITCPKWCGISADEHAARRWDNEGRCVHQAVVVVDDSDGSPVGEEAQRFGEPIELVLLVTTDPAGRVVEAADVLINGQESSLEQLGRLAIAIVGLGEMYRATPGRRKEL
jgi:hypothetical protein